MITYGKIEGGSVVEQIVLRDGEDVPNEGTWLPIIVVLNDYDPRRYYEGDRVDEILSDRVVRKALLIAREITVLDIDAECQRRIIDHTGGTDLLSSVIKQINDKDGALTSGIERLRACRRKLKAMRPIPYDYDSDTYWAT